MRSDLHVHSCFSDGADSVEVVLAKAEAAGIEVLSFVDHDTTETFEAAEKLARDRGIRLIPGIEISAYDFKRQRKVHVLGYRYERTVHIRAICDALLQRRQQHSSWQLREIQRAGIPVDADQLKPAINSAQTLYKQHIMRAITGEPFPSSEYQTLYRSLFKGQGVAAGPDIEYIDVHEAVKAIKADGGLAVVAHPGQLDSYALIEELVSDGLDGVEAYHPDHCEADIERAKALAGKYRLWITGGSDYHGEFGRSQHLGGFDMPDELVAAWS